MKYVLSCVLVLQAVFTIKKCILTYLVKFVTVTSCTKKREREKVHQKKVNVSFNFIANFVVNRKMLIASFLFCFFSSCGDAELYALCLQRYEFLSDSGAGLQYNLTIHSCWEKKPWIIFDKYEMETLRHNFLPNRKWDCHTVGKETFLIILNKLHIFLLAPLDSLCVFTSPLTPTIRRKKAGLKN